MAEVKFKMNVIINGEIECLTGLHVGTSKENVEIGGIDNSVVVNPLNGEPYIPGSSLKGKMRSLSELSKGITRDGGVCSCGDCDICLVFGSKDNKGRGPTRLIVRDSTLIGETKTEIKMENYINRNTGRAVSPRSQERVPAGTNFQFEMVFSVYEGDDKNSLKTVFESMSQVEDNYIGGSGSRGYGKIKFSDVKIILKKIENYTDGELEKTALKYDSVSSILSSYDEIASKL